MYQKRKIRAEKKKDDSQKSFSKVPISWYPGHMAKTRREIKEKIDLIDIIYEVIDARMPLSSKIVDIDNLVKNKPRILIVTKYDICDQIETNKILEEYEKQGYTVIPVDLVNGKNVNKIITESEKLLASMNEERKRKGLKPRNIRALVIGSPNVGKSTLINRLVGKKVTSIGDKPGAVSYTHLSNYNKDEILELYLNTSYFGNGFYSVKSASLGYFNKLPKDMNDSESIMLAGIPNAPSLYNPIQNKNLAIERQRQVINKMIKYGNLDKVETEKIIK